MHRRAHRLLWRSLDRLASPWRSLDVLLDGKHDRMLDLLLGSVRASNGVRYYKDGWGDVNVPVSFYAWLGTYGSVARANDVWLPRSIDAQLGAPREEAPGVLVRHGSFASPGRRAHTHARLHSRGTDSRARPRRGAALEIRALLPSESRTAHIKLVTPAPPNSLAGTPGAAAASKGLVVLLAGTGEHGFHRRMAFASVPLAMRGISSIILESPYYGLRKPPEQRGSKLRFVSDLTVLGRTTIEETCSLVKWAHDELGVRNISVAGVSMGGLHAAMTAALSQLEVGAVSYLGPHSAAPVFTQGLLSKFIEWKCLQRELGEGGDSAMQVMERFLALTDIANFPSPHRPDRAVFVVAAEDQYVPSDECSKRWLEMQQTRWHGSQVVVVPGGHVSATVFGSHNFRHCVEWSLGLHAQLKLSHCL
jgi:hypothetical protein